jgi:hypothetical protein
MNRESAIVLAIVAVGAVIVGAMSRTDGDRPGQFFSWAELQATSQPVENVAPPAARARLQRLVERVLDPWRIFVGVPLGISSGYRTPQLNRLIDGAPQSQHLDGEAADVVRSGWTSPRLAASLLASGVPFDQVVWYGWAPHVHVSHAYTRQQRGEVLYSPSRGVYLRQDPEGWTA